MDKRQKEQILEIVKKVCLKTLDNIKGQTHLEKVRNDQNKEFENGENAERKYVLETINSEIKHLETLNPDLFDGMFLLRKDLENFREFQDKNKIKSFCNKERIIILCDSAKKGDLFEGVEVSIDWFIRNSQYGVA